MRETRGLTAPLKAWVSNDPEIGGKLGAGALKVKLSGKAPNLPLLPLIKQNSQLLALFAVFLGREDFVDLHAIR